MTNLELVQELYAAFGRRDTDAIRRIFHPEIEWIQNAGFPGGGTHRGAETVLTDVFAKFRVEWETWQAIVTEWLDAADTIIAIGVYRGTFKTTGRWMEAAFAHVYTVQDGRIVKFRQYTDTLKIAEARQPASLTAEHHKRQD